MQLIYYNFILLQEGTGTRVLDTVIQFALFPLRVRLLFFPYLSKKWQTAECVHLRMKQRTEEENCRSCLPITQELITSGRTM